MNMRISVVVSFALVCGAAVAPAETVLVDARTDRQEVTEVRFDVPENAVITGLGFRANYDNITTMYCRYHRLTADGKLVDPAETRLGSEPDHGLEARIDLPEGWVMVGFGAAGQPEWDVTLLRVWARPLLPDGRLGDVREFSAGVNPDRGPERYVVLEEPDRALTGAGLRFHSNDIAGIYAASRRILPVTAEVRANLDGFDRAFWEIDGLDVCLSGSVRRAVAQDRIGDLVVRIPASPEPRAEEIRALNRLAAALGRNGGVLRLRLGPAPADRLAALLRRLPDVEGVILDPPHGSTPIEPLLAVCRSSGKSLFFALDSLQGGSTTRIDALPEDVGILLPAEVLSRASAEKVAELGERPILAAFDLAGRAGGGVGAADIRINRLASMVVRVALAGADGYVARVNPDDFLDRIRPDVLNLEALRRFGDNPLASPAEIRRSLCEEYYGPAAEPAEAALRHAEAASDLVFRVLGFDFLADGNRLRPFDSARDRLRKLAAGSGGPEAERIAELLHPTDAVLGDVRLEKKTARWLVQQAQAAAGRARETADTPATAALVSSIDRLADISDFWQEVAFAFMYASLYEEDTADRTKADALAALDRLESRTGDAPYEALETFIKSTRAAIDRATHEAPLARAIARVREEIRRGDDEAAAQAFAAIFANEAFLPHLSKRNAVLGELASSLRALWNPEGLLRSVRGADGQWRVVRKAGRWCWTTTEKGPCVYFDVTVGPLDPPADYALSFEYFDEGTGRLWIHYDSDYPGQAAERQYHPAEPVRLTDTGQWKEATVRLTNCLFSNSENVQADMRFLVDDLAPLWIRDLRLEPSP